MPGGGELRNNVSLDGPGVGFRHWKIKFVLISHPYTWTYIQLLNKCNCSHSIPYIFKPWVCHQQYFLCIREIRENWQELADTERKFRQWDRRLGHALNIGWNRTWKLATLLAEQIMKASPLLRCTLTALEIHLHVVQWYLVFKTTRLPTKCWS